jgi:prevent-host-death family protein
MRTIGAYEAKTNFSRLLDEVDAGETIAITRHGKVVAVLTPPFERPNTHAAIDAWLNERRGINLGPELSLRDLIDEGRRG